MGATQGGKDVGLAPIEAKIDILDTIIDNLHDTDIPDIHSDLDVTYLNLIRHDQHFHVANKVYGKSATTSLMVQDSCAPLTVEGGDDAYGTEVLLCKAGFAGSYFDPGEIQVVAVDTINSPTIIALYAGGAGSGVAMTAEADDDIITAAGHGVVDGDLVFFDDLATEANGINKSTVYYVRDMSGTGFKVSLTSGGAAINITGDIVSGTVKKIIAPAKQTEIMVCMSALNVDCQPITVACPRIPSSDVFWCRAKSKAGDTNLVSFFLNAHSYT